MPPEEQLRHFREGVAWEEGVGRAQDFEQARSSYVLAAEHGHNPSRVRLALLFEIGRGGGVRMGEALELARRAADEGDVLAQHHAGRWLLELGEVSEAVHYLSASATSGHVPAILRLAYAQLDRAEGAPAALETLWEHQASSVLATTLLGCAYAEARGVKRDRRLARELLERSAELGDAQAALNLALLLLYREEDPPPGEVATAMALLEKCADEGVFAACALLGEILATGFFGVAKHVERAIPLLEHGRLFNSPRSSFVLAYLANRGEAPEISVQRRFALASEAALHDDEFAHALMAHFYAMGIGVRRSRMKARLHIERAIALGHPTATELSHWYPQPWPLRIRRLLRVAPKLHRNPIGRTGAQRP